VVVIFISIVVVSYPGERLAKLVSVPIPMLCWEKSAPISDCFLHGPVNMVTGRPRSPFFNVLVLPGQTLTDVKKAEAGQLTRSFRGRDLAGAILIGADIRFMDFTGTNLDEARLDRANASGSVFGCDDTGDSVLTSPSWPNHGCASLRGASLYGANLSGASFMNARMEGSVLLDANLSGARLLNAHLEYTVLTNANLTAAYLGSTRLHNAYMYQTNLSAAMLDQSEWGGALLEQCKFEFASVGRSRITEVGDTVGQPVLAFATFDLGGSAVPYANNASQFDEMRTRMLKRLLEEELRRNPWLKQYSLPDRVNPLIAVFTPDFYKSFYRKEAETNWGLLKVKAKDQWNFMNISVKKSNSKDVEGSKRRFLAERFAELACDGENAPFVARGLISNDIFSRVGASADIFLAKVLDISNCRGAAGLTAQEHAAVEARVASAKKSNAMRPESYPLPPAITAASAKMKSGKR
jgi:uncharacterized protein YjbI with pentapeptide repeats